MQIHVTHDAWWQLIHWKKKAPLPRHARLLVHHRLTSPVDDSCYIQGGGVFQVTSYIIHIWSMTSHERPCPLCIQQLSSTGIKSSEHVLTAFFFLLEGRWAPWLTCICIAWQHDCRWIIDPYINMDKKSPKKFLVVENIFWEFFCQTFVYFYF